MGICLCCHLLWYQGCASRAKATKAVAEDPCSLPAVSSLGTSRPVVLMSDAEISRPSVSTTTVEDRGQRAPSLVLFALFAMLWAQGSVLKRTSDQFTHPYAPTCEWQDLCILWTMADYNTIATSGTITSSFVFISVAACVIPNHGK